MIFWKKVSEIQKNKFKILYLKLKIENLKKYLFSVLSRKSLLTSFVPKFFRIPTTFDSISLLIWIDANFVYILVVKKRRSGLSKYASVDDLCFLKGYFDWNTL
jgi:hypothetical protein